MKKYKLLMVLPAFMFAGINAQIMTIDECRTQAIENNKQLMNARLEMDASKETKKEAFTNYFPTVSATGMAINANTEMVKMDAEVPIVGELPMSFMKNGKAASVTAIQPIFAGGRIVNGNKLAEIGNEASGLQMEITEDEVIINTESYFWQIVSMKEKLITIGLLDKQLENIYNDVKISVEAGVAMRNDLLRVELQRQELESTKLKLENGINIVSLLLAQYIGHPDSVFEISYTDFSSPLAPQAVYVSPQEAVVNRNEYKLLQKNVDAGNLKTKMEIGKNLPSVGIGAGYTYHDMTGKSNNFGAVFATVTVPISDWWGGSHSIKKQKIKTRQSIIEKENGRELIEVQIAKNWNDLNEAYQQIALAETSIKSAEENMRLNTDYYSVGLSTMTDVLDAQTLLQQSYNRLTDAYTEYKLKMSEYMIATNR